MHRTPTSPQRHRLQSSTPRAASSSSRSHSRSVPETSSGDGTRRAHAPHSLLPAPLPRTALPALASPALACAHARRPSAQGMLKMSKGEKATLTCTPDFACTREHIEPSAARRALGPPTRAEITRVVILHGRRPARRAARHPARRDPGVRRRAHWHQRKALLLSQPGSPARRTCRVSVWCVRRVCEDVPGHAMLSTFERCARPGRPGHCWFILQFTHCSTPSERHTHSRACTAHTRRYSIEFAEYARISQLLSLAYSTVRFSLYCPTTHESRLSLTHTLSTLATSRGLRGHSAHASFLSFFTSFLRA